MAKLTRVPAKVFAGSAAADEIGQFGSAVAGSKLETADVATIQGLSAWLDGWSEALVSGNRYPALQEMNGAFKVLSYQGAYALQEGIPEYDAATTYYIGSIVKKTGTFELYGSLTDDNVGNALTVDTEWKLLIDLNTLSNALVYTASTADMPTLANNVTDANNDIDFSAGFCYDLTTNVKITNTILTKQLDAVFVEGTDVGGLDTGLKANNTWYHCFAISKADSTADFLFSTSATAPTMPTDFINKRRIGSISTNSSGNILGFVQNSDLFLYKNSIVDYGGAGNATAQTLTISTPVGVICEPVLSASTANSSLLISSLEQVDETPLPTLTNETTANSSSDITNSTGFSVTTMVYIHPVLTNTSSQIRYRNGATNPTNSITIRTRGYYDKRGEN